METTLARILKLSSENRNNPEFRFISLAHLIDKQILMECHVGMDGSKPVGIVGINKEDYEQNLSENLENLMDRIKRNGA